MNKLQIFVFIAFLESVLTWKWGLCIYDRGGQPWSWRAAGCAGFCCYSAINWSMKAVDYTVNSPHLALGSEFFADFRVKTKASTHCGSPGPGLATPDLWPQTQLSSVYSNNKGNCCSNNFGGDCISVHKCVLYVYACMCEAGRGRQLTIQGHQASPNDS